MYLYILEDIGVTLPPFIYLLFSPHVSYFVWKRNFFRLRIRLPSTRIRWKRSLKTQLSENAFQSGIFWKRRFRVSVWTEKTGTFLKRWRIRIGSSLPAQKKKNGGKWWFYILLCMKRLWNISGCQKHVQSYCTNYYKHMRNVLWHFRDFVVNGNFVQLRRLCKQNTQFYFLTLTYSNCSKSARK